LAFEELGFIVDKESVKAGVAAMMLKLEALGIEIPDAVYIFMFSAFIADVKNGLVQLAGMKTPPMASGTQPLPPNGTV
jgi:hypothetical protein